MTRHEDLNPQAFLDQKTKRKDNEILVNVRKKTRQQTESCRPSALLSGLPLNSREGSDSVASEKTLSNPSRESRHSSEHLGALSTHNGTCPPRHRISQEVIVFVLDKKGNPLMPTQSGKARRLLKAGLARVVRCTPFVIQMRVQTRCYKQKIVAGFDTGTKYLGVVARFGDKVLYAAKIILRGEEIKKSLKGRRLYRRTRRSRKTRYRKPQFLNRSASTKKDRLPPSVKHIVQAHLREKAFLESILPIHSWFVETASFDIHKISNPDVSDYQKGTLHGFENLKAFVLARDHHTCQKCKATNVQLHVHHIVFRSKGGPDHQDNLVTLCQSCHHLLHASDNAQKESLKLCKKVKAKTRDATKMSILRSQLKKNFGVFKETFGFETKIKRRSQNLEKSHTTDALMASCELGEKVTPPREIFTKKLVSKGDYKQTSGAHSEKKIPTGKLFGLRKFDHVRTVKGTGYVKGKRSTGYFAIADIDGKVISNSVNVKKTTVRLSARNGVLISRTKESASSSP